MDDFQAVWEEIGRISYYRKSLNFHTLSNKIYKGVTNLQLSQCQPKTALNSCLKDPEICTFLNENGSVLSIYLHGIRVLGERRRKLKKWVSKWKGFDNAVVFVSMQAEIFLKSMTLIITKKKHCGLWYNELTQLDYVPYSLAKYGFTAPIRPAELTLARLLTHIYID